MEYFEEEAFKQLDSKITPLQAGQYEHCTFVECDISESDLRDVRFIECEFVNTNLSNCNLYKCSFQNVVFRECKLLGLLFERSDQLNFSLRCYDCNLSHSSFFGMKLSQSVFEDSILHGVGFEEAKLVESTLVSCDLLNARFEKSDLSKCDFRDSKNYQINPEMNMIKGAQFSYPEVLALLDKYKLKIE